MANMITLILSSSLSPHLPSIWPIYIWPQATSLSRRITLQFSVTMFTVAASCNCLVYTLSLNTTQNETLPSLLSSCDRTLPLLSLCCDSLHMSFVHNCTCWNIYNVFSSGSRLCLCWRLRWEWDGVTLTAGLCLRLRLRCGDNSSRSLIVTVRAILVRKISRPMVSGIIKQL